MHGKADNSTTSVQVATNAKVYQVFAHGHLLHLRSPAVVSRQHHHRRLDQVLRDGHLLNLRGAAEAAAD
eukprot:3419401-Pleurochrysis_carterae.AAC.2